MASVSERSKVNCLSSSLWGELLCAATKLCFMTHVQYLCPSLSALQTMLLWEDITTGVAMVR